MRHARWQVADASCAICTSLRKLASAVADAPAVRKDLTATCSRCCADSWTSMARLHTTYASGFTLVNFSALVAVLRGTRWCRWRLELEQLPRLRSRVRYCIWNCWSCSKTTAVTQGAHESNSSWGNALVGQEVFRPRRIEFTLEQSARPRSPKPKNCSKSEPSRPLPGGTS